MAQITLHYFAIRGYGEYIRLLLIDQGIEFTDHRFGYNSEEWAEFKKSMTFSQVPFLEIGNKKLVQTGTIMRYLGKHYGLNGSNEEEAEFIDMFFEGVRDVRTKYVLFVFYELETKENFANVTLATGLSNLEKLLKTHCNGEKFVAGEKISYADYLFFEELDIFKTHYTATFDKFPVLKKYHQRMAERPNLKSYLEKRAADNVLISAVDKV